MAFINIPKTAIAIDLKPDVALPSKEELDRLAIEKSLKERKLREEEEELNRKRLAMDEEKARVKPVKEKFLCDTTTVHPLPPTSDFESDTIQKYNDFKNKQLLKAKKPPPQTELAEKKPRAESRKKKLLDAAFSSQEKKESLLSTNEAIRRAETELKSAEFENSLFSKDDFPNWDRKTNPLKDMDWIFQNLDAKVQSTDASSPGAWALLMRIRDNDDMRDDFYKLYINRRLPSRQVIEEMEGRLNDDGHELVDFINLRLKSLSDKAKLS